MNKIFTLLLFTAFVSLTDMPAQNATLSGVLTEAGSANPLISASVQAGDHGTITDLEGNYDLSLPSGTYDVEFSYVGFETFTESLTFRSGEKRTLDVELKPSANLLQTATVTAGKHERALGEVTVSIEVIKPALLQSTNQSGLSGLLDKVPGVNLVGDQANIRGGSGFSYGAGSRVLLLVDDMPILQADAGFPQWEDVPIENIEQVEVVKGAASALYGSSALNGIINVRTAYARSEPQTKIATYFGYHQSPKNEEAQWWDDGLKDLRYRTGGNFSHKQKFGKLDLVLGGSYNRSESVNDSSYSRRGRVNVGLRYRITERLSVGLNTNVNKSKGASFFFWGGVGDQIYRPGAAVSRSKNTRYNIDPFVTWFDPANNRHKLQGRFFSVNNNTGTSEADQTNVSDVGYGEYQFQRKMERSGLVMTAGFVFLGTKVRAPLYGDTTFTSRNMAGYLQLDKKVLEKINLSAGFRYENNLVLTPEIIHFQNGNLEFTDTVPGGEIKESKPVFRFGASFEVSPTTFLRASWGQGYRFPTIAEKFIFTQFGGTPILPNLELTSETGWTAEIGLRKGFQTSGFNGFFDFAAFRSEFQNMMEFNIVLDAFPPSFQSQNVGDTRISGYEASVTGRGKIFGLETSLLTGYTYIDPKFKVFGLNSQDPEGVTNAQNSSVCDQPNDPQRKKCHNILKYRFKHSFKFDLETGKGKWTVGVATLYNSNMENIDAAFEAFIVPGLRQYRQEHQNGDLVWSARAAYKVSKHYKMTFLVDNIFNRVYVNRPGLLEPPRSLTLRLDFDF